MELRTNLNARFQRWGPAIAPALILTFAVALPLPVATAQPVWSGLNGGTDAGGYGLGVFDEDGLGARPPMLYVAGGQGTFASTAFMLGAMRWDGWEAFPVGEGIVVKGVGGIAREIGGFREPGATFQPGLYAGGNLKKNGMGWNGITRFLPDQWHDVGGGLTAPIAVFDFAHLAFTPGVPAAPSSLVAGGQFWYAGGVEAESLARWDGTSWHTLGEGVSNNSTSTTATVYALAVFDDDGPGPRPPALYVGGSFYYAGGVYRNNIARWDGQNWEGLGAGLNGTVDSLAVYDEDGPGPKLPALFAGGAFTAEVGKPAYSMRKIGRWDGKAWTPVGGWLSDGLIYSLFAADEDGPGPAKECLFAGGTFNVLPDLTPVSGIARWDGSTWTTVGDYGVHGGLGAGTVRTMAFFDEDGPGPNPGGLYVGGSFWYADGVYSKHIARWGVPLPPKCSPDCDKDADLDLFDFLCFQGRFAAADPWADFERDGDHDLFDFLEFQGQFASGCP